MKIEFGEFKVEFPYEKYLEKYMGKNNSFETMFEKPNPEILNDFFKKMPIIMADYFEELAKTMEHHAKKSKQKKKDK
jgi:hypothetical protein